MAGQPTTGKALNVFQEFYFYKLQHPLFVQFLVVKWDDIVAGISGIMSIDIK